ncbi:REGULATOR OF FATTY-ACID COMPOSITION family protein [Salix suchowensis]|nr:REGULATOR OF FATTY-ACID COMPOSITION family protein [Salix suchowensis]
METLLYRTATFPTPKQRVFSNQNKSLFIASGSHSFSARPLFPSLALRKSVIVEAKKSNKNNNNKKNKQDTHSFVAKPDETTGPYPESILLKEKKAQEDGRVLPEFADAEEEKLFEVLNLALQSELNVERVRHYEVVYLIHEKHDEEVGSVNEKVQDFVREKKGKIWRFNDWGMRRLAYKIQKAKNAHYILMNFELEARWINDFKNMLDKDERVIRHLVIKMDEAITEDCPPPPEFHKLQGGMDNYDEEGGLDYDDDDGEASDEEWEAEAEVVYVDETEGSVISLLGYRKDDEGNNEVRHSKFASASNTGKKRIPEKGGS